MNADLEELQERVESLEEVVETVCRPAAELAPPERVHAIELAGYEAQLKIAALEIQIAALQAEAAITAERLAEALNKANAVVNSRIWRALVTGSGFLLRFTGRS
jgi:hypothetical protein